MSIVGEKVKVLADGHEITVKQEREIDGIAVYTDEDGNIYSEDELDIRYRLSEYSIMFHALQEAGLYDEHDHFDLRTMKAVVDGFMEGMIRAGYIKDDREQD